MRFLRSLVALAALTALGGLVSVGAQSPPPPPQAPPQSPQFPKPPNMRQRQPPPRGAEPAQSLGKGLVRVGTVTADTNKREVSVAGVVNDVSVLEFLANTKGGFKAYESAIELDTNAISYNVALLLIGLDSTRATIAKVDRQPDGPSGDAVEILVQWKDGAGVRTVSAEELVIDGAKKQPLRKAPFVYTGSMMAQPGVLLADIDGVLLGFMHTRSSLIDYGGKLESAYGSYRLNTDLVKPGTPVTVIVRATTSK